MMFRDLPLVLKNLLRSKTRLIATVGGCAVAAFVVCFFLSSEHSLSAGRDAKAQCHLL